MLNILILFPLILNFFADNCNDLHTGTFKLVNEDDMLYIITRTEDKQVENIPAIGVVVEFDIKWTSDCSYILYNKNILQEGDVLPTRKVDTLFNEIIAIEGDLHKVASYAKEYDVWVEAILMKYNLDEK